MKMNRDSLEPYLKIERLPVITNWVLSLFLFYSLSNLIWIFTPGKSVAPAIQPSAPAKPLPNLATWHLFGEYQPTRRALQPAQLPLKIVGIFYATPPATSFVLISVSNQPAKLFRPGQALLPGVVIDEILHDSIVLKHNSAWESLSLPVPELKFAPLPQSIDLNQGS